MNPKPPSQAKSRRDFLRTALATGALMPFGIRPLFAQGSGAAPSGKVNLACVGIGNRGADIIHEFAKTGLANIVP